MFGIFSGLALFVLAFVLNGNISDVRFAAMLIAGGLYYIGYAIQLASHHELEIAGLSDMLKKFLELKDAKD